MVASQPGAWVTLGERPVWSGDWLDVFVADVQTPTGRRIAYDVVRTRSAGVATLMINHVGQVLLIYRHRFVPNVWSWELPAGDIEPGEQPFDAAAREVQQATGWELLQPRLIWGGWRCPERFDHGSYVVEGHAGRQVASSDPDQVSAVRWFDPREAYDLLRTSAVSDVVTWAALLWWVWRQGGRPTAVNKAGARP